MLEFFHKLFSKEYMPHGMCYLWDPAVLWLHVISDGLTAAAYYAIPFLLFYFVKRRRDVAFRGIFVAFGIFILACGTTHLMAAVTVWSPVYRLEGVIKAITAAASLATFLMLVPMLPALIALPSPAQLARVNQSLAREIEERRAAEEEVRRVNEDLEARVARRTAERRALEDQLLQSQKMEAVGRLAGGVAHDFNNLLTVILGYSEMLRDQVRLDATAVEYSDEVLHAAERASALTYQLLAFSRRQVAVPRVVDLNEIVRGIDKMLRRIIGEDIRLEARMSPGLPAVKVDPSHIDQVIMNLAVNSRDAMPEGGKLTIETAEVELTGEYAGRHIGVPAGHYVMLAVSDTGSGMDAATRARLFEPFFTTKDKGKGTGLGLSIVYGIVKQNGGEILVYSEPDRGTAFKIYLPAVMAAAEAILSDSEDESAAPATGTILLVEDDPQVRNLTRTMLAHLGYRVLEAESADQALRIVSAHEGPLDLMLTDVVMPGMSGTELAHQLQAVRPGARVLYMSGYTDNGVIDQAILAADTPFIQKPFTSAGLGRKVRDVLRG
ncbi:MAG: response regulator [Candidatus Solibacter sp.]|nr:response regulator [Candidatus Solibacter sp.]